MQSVVAFGTFSLAVVMMHNWRDREMLSEPELGLNKLTL
jgi:hypothetical protein